VLFVAPVAACEASGDPWLDLRIEPGEFAGPNREERVQVFADGCVMLWRPDYFVAPGNYTLDIDQSDIDRLKARIDAPLLVGFQAEQVFAAVRAAQRQDGEAEFFVVNDADTYRIGVQRGNERQQMQIDGLFQLHEQYPQIDSLAALAQLVGELKALAARPGRRPLASSP